MTTVLVVDDEKDILDLLQYNLQQEQFQVLTATNGTMAIELAQRTPDLIILDVMMPEVNGLEVFRRLKGDPATESIPVIFLTAKESEFDEVLGLELGAEDYVVKPVSMRTLLARIRVVLRRHTRKEQFHNRNAEIIQIDNLVINVPNYMVKVDGKEVFLRKKEFETLIYLVKQHDRVVSREELLNSVWGENVHVIDRTVDVHIRKIREKLGPIAQRIETVKGVGYRFRM